MKTYIKHIKNLIKKDIIEYNKNGGTNSFGYLEKNIIKGFLFSDNKDGGLVEKNYYIQSISPFLSVLIIPIEKKSILDKDPTIRKIIFNPFISFNIWKYIKHNTETKKSEIKKVLNENSVAFEEVGIIR